MIDHVRDMLNIIWNGINNYILIEFIVESNNYALPENEL
jgi:hypothetical protein